MGTRSKWQWAVGGGVVLAMVLAAATARACMDYRPRPAGLVKDAVSEDAAKAKAAVEKLRAMGPQGLGALMSVYDLQIRGLLHAIQTRANGGVGIDEFQMCSHGHAAFVRRIASHRDPRQRQAIIHFDDRSALVHKAIDGATRFFGARHSESVTGVRMGRTVEVWTGHKATWLRQG